MMQIINKTNFMKRLGPYNKPCINIVTGLIASCIHGTVNPVFGVLVTNMLFSLMIVDPVHMKSEAWKWALYMFICSLVDLVAVFVQRFSFGVIGENITLNIRFSLYASLLKKNIGWFDLRENSAGVLTSVLASEAQVLNGASTEGLAVICETSFALLSGIIMGFVFSWKISLVALACVPFMVIGGAINAKI
jgi:ATP-binding cassette subfamily B (MDR/TAP) protein 1